MLKINGQTSYGWLLLLGLLLQLLVGCGTTQSTTAAQGVPHRTAPLAVYTPAPKAKGYSAFYYPSGKESFAKIAAKHKVNEAALRRFNPRSQHNIPPAHHRLRIPESNQDARKAGPYYYRIQAGDTFSNLAQHFHLALITLLQANPNAHPEKLQIGQRVVIPVTKRNQNDYLWPVANPSVKINFSWQRWGLHQGIALATKHREEIFPIAPGKVVFAGEMRGFGKVVIVKHNNQQQSVYAYCHALFVEQDTHLSGRHPVCAAGTQRQIDRSGIYFELREAGRAIPPENYLPALPWP